MSGNPAGCSDDGWNKLRQTAQGTAGIAAVNNGIAGESSGTRRNPGGGLSTAAWAFGGGENAYLEYGGQRKARSDGILYHVGASDQDADCGAKAFEEEADILGAEEPLGADRERLQRQREKRRDEELQQLFAIEQYVNMALSYMRLGSETTDFVLRQTDLDEVIRMAVRRYARHFISKKIVLHYEETGTRVLTDEKWLGFVIEQLLSNALKYTHEGSITIGMEEGRLTITDTGIGIRAEDLPRVCEKGYTGYNGHANQKSTGIGLYLCSTILKKLGHSFTITSQEGTGTRMMIGFPEES